MKEAVRIGSVDILHTPGHTPGSVSILVESGGKSGDVDRELSPESRRGVVEEAVGRNALVARPHLEEGPVFGHMVMLNGRRVWQGVDVPARRQTVATSS